jgi:hypothetical protein
VHIWSHDIKIIIKNQRNKNPLFYIQAYIEMFVVGVMSCCTIKSFNTLLQLMHMNVKQIGDGC